ncbi:MAG: hypothetical protein R3C11_25480 [Planctomycetaceae bacterium]
MNFKNLITKIKTANYKTFFINHVEKFLVGFAVLFVLYCLAATNWSMEQKNPADLMAKADAAKTTYTQRWTAEEKQTFEANSNLTTKSSKSRTLSLSTNMDSVPDMDWPILEEQEPAVEPQFLAVASGLKGDSGRTRFQLIDLTKMNQVGTAMEKIESTSEDKLSIENSELFNQFGFTPEQLAQYKEAQREQRRQPAIQR